MSCGTKLPPSYFFVETNTRLLEYDEVAISEVGQVFMIATVREDAANASAQCTAQTPAGKR